MADLSQIIGDSVALLEAQRIALLQETVTARAALNESIAGLSAFERGIKGLIAEQARQTKQAARAAEKAQVDAALKEAKRLAEIEAKHAAVAAAKSEREAAEKEAADYFKSKGSKSK